MSFNIRERNTSYFSIRSTYRPKHFLNDDFKRSTRYPCLSNLLESRLSPRIVSLSLLVFYVTCNDISVIYVTAQMCRRTEEEVVPTVGLQMP